MKKLFCIVYLISIFSSVPLWSFAEHQLVVSEAILVGKAWPANGGRFALWTEKNRQYVVYYNSEGRTVAAQRLLTETSWKQKILSSKMNNATRVSVDESSTIAGFDGHNDICMAVDSEGYIHVSLNHHVNRLTYFRSTLPHDITTLAQVDAMVGDGSQQEDRVTYPKFMNAPTGELLFHYRHGKSGAGYEIYNIYDLSSQTWSRFLDTPLISGESLRNAYQVGPFLGSDGWYHLGWVWRDSGDASTSHSPSYARSHDLKNWETVSGEKLALPIRFGDIGTRIDTIPVKGGIINGGLKLGFDSKNGLVVTYHKFDEMGYTQVYAARFCDAAWKIQKITDWKYRWDFGGHGTLDFELSIEGPQSNGDGKLRMKYSHRKYGSGVLVFNEQTLAPIGVESQRPAYPVELDVLESNFQDMKVHFVLDSGMAYDSSTHYRLRWEAFGSGKDFPRPVTDAPSDLILYKIVSHDCVREAK